MMVQIFQTYADPVVVSTLRAGGVAVLRTDTLYGIVARADDPDAVERVYAVKRRDPTKGCIILVADESMLYDAPPQTGKALLDEVWPGPVSVVVPSPHAPQWLRRTDDDTIAYRCPAEEPLRQLIAQTGPLIAPSANPEGMSPAMTIESAVAYFGDQVDIYVDGGRVPDDTPPSQLIVVQDDGTTTRLR